MPSSPMAVVDDSAAARRGSAEEPEHARMVAGMQRMSLAGGFGHQQYHQQHHQNRPPQHVAVPCAHPPSLLDASGVVLLLGQTQSSDPRNRRK